jgi:uncharacterized protein (DUF2141 family)
MKNFPKPAMTWSRAVLCAVTTSSAIVGTVHAQNSAALADAACSKTIELSNVRPNQGTVFIAVYGSAETYNKGALLSIMLKAGARDKVSIPLCMLDATEVAVSVFQDINSNGKLDSNPFGIPSEPYGASGKPSNFGAPTWDATKVSLSGTDAQRITVKLN